MIATERVNRRRTSRPAFAETRLRTAERAVRLNAPEDAVAEAVRGRLCETFGPTGDRLEVTVTAGRILLGGRVASYYAKQRASHAALAASDGLLVQNDLRVA